MLDGSQGIHHKRSSHLAHMLELIGCIFAVIAVVGGGYGGVASRCDGAASRSPVSPLLATWYTGKTTVGIRYQSIYDNRRAHLERLRGLLCVQARQ